MEVSKQVGHGGWTPALHGLHSARGIMVNTSLRVLLTYFAGLTDATVRIKDSGSAKTANV